MGILLTRGFIMTRTKPVSYSITVTKRRRHYITPKLSLRRQTASIMSAAFRPSVATVEVRRRFLKTAVNALSSEYFTGQLSLASLRGR